MISDSAVLASFFAYQPSFTGGVFVSADADFNNDGFVDVLTGAGFGGGPHVRLLDGTKLNLAGADGVIAPEAELESIFATDPSFRGAVRGGEADADQNGVDEIVLGAGPGGAPLVILQETADGPLSQFLAFDPSFAGGVFVD